jgi:hypothetical protein
MPADARLARINAGARELAAQLILHAVFARLSLARVGRCGFAGAAATFADAEVALSADVPRRAGARADFPTSATRC